jgi:hypothetical protein
LATAHALARKEAGNVQAHFDSYGRLETLRRRCAGMQLAKEQGSEVTVLYVMPDYSALMYSGEGMVAYNPSEMRGTPS